MVSIYTFSHYSMDTSGHPLSYYRIHEPIRHNVIGKRAKQSMYTIHSFNVVNILDAKTLPSDTLRDTINSFVREVLRTPEMKNKRITMCLHHPCLREESIFINLSSNVNPGESICRFFDKVAISNTKVDLRSPMSFDFWLE